MTVAESYWMDLRAYLFPCARGENVRTSSFKKYKLRCLNPQFSMYLNEAGRRHVRPSFSIQTAPGIWRALTRTIIYKLADFVRGDRRSKISFLESIQWIPKSLLKEWILRFYRYDNNSMGRPHVPAEFDQGDDSSTNGLAGGAGERGWRTTE